MLLAVLQRATSGWDHMVGRAAAGDARARRELVELAGARIRRLAVAMGARERDLEEVVSAALEEALTGLGVLAGEPLSAAGLDRIAASTILTRVERWPLLALREPEGDPGRRASLDRVTAHLQTIEPRKRLALVLSANGAAVEDVADVLDCTSAAAASRVDQARRSIVSSCPSFETTLRDADDGLLDALAERRVLRAALATMDRAPTIGSVPPPPPRRRWGWAALGAAAVAVLALLGLAVLWPAGPEPARPRLDSVVALSQGRASIGGTAARAGQWVGAGAAFALGSADRLGLALGDGSGGWLGPNARGLVDEWSLDRARVRLDAGTLVARVEAGVDRRFEVRAGAAIVRARRAVFSVTAGRPPLVRVLEGTIEVGGREVRAGHEVRGRRVEPAARDALALDRASAPGRFRAKGARLMVTSTPDGALVTLGARPVGRTPLSWIAPPGEVRLTVSLAGRAPIVEELSLRSGDRLDRRFSLTPVPGQTDETPSWARPQEEQR